MRHFYTDANYCCVSQSFIHEELVGFTCATQVLLPPWCPGAETEMSPSRSDSCTKETPAPAWSSLRKLNNASQSDFNISVSCLRPTVTLFCTKEHWLAADTDVGTESITHPEWWVTGKTSRTKHYSHFSTCNEKCNLLIPVHFNNFALLCCNTQASQLKMLQGKDEWAFHVNSQLWTFFRIIHCNTIPAARIPQWKMQKIKKKNTSLWENKGLVVSDKPLNLGQSSQRGMHTLIAGT